MTIIVGFAPDGRSRAPLHLAGMLARSWDEDLLVSAVVPVPWPPGVARVDAEYQAWLEGTAEDALTQARARVPADVEAAFAVHRARSAPAGLLELAEEREASAIVVGSSAAGGLGHVWLGSVSDRLLHSSHVPVALTPRGFRCKPVVRVARVSAAYGGSHEADELVVAAAGLAARAGAPLRLISFVVRPPAPVTAGVGVRAEEPVIEEWVAEIEAAGRAALEPVDHLPAPPPALEAALGRGETWAEALEDVEWDDGDILVVGSSAIGPVRRVFLGSRASKIVRNSPVPVVVVPRAASAELADEAARAQPRSA